MQPTKKIIFDFFDGNHTSIQRKMIEEWLDDSHNEDIFYQYMDEWETLHPQFFMDQDRSFENLKDRIDATEEIHFSKARWFNRYKITQTFKWIAAASVVTILGILSFQYFYKSESISYETLVLNNKNETGDTYEKQNLSNKPLLVTLPDGSSVIMQSMSKLTYSPREFGKINREIIFSGEGFFEVQKDPKKPFFVYSNEMITKVLGTSFTIRANPKDSKMEVIVKTGKVAVFMQNDKQKNLKINNNELVGLVLMPNEKVGISRIESIIEKPVLLRTNEIEIPIHKLAFDFDDVSAIEVIEVLKQAYNIKINYDADRLSNCRLTAHLADEPLMEKIKLICLALEASFYESESEIFIKAKGCK